MSLISERSPTTFETLDSLQLSIIEAGTIIDMCSLIRIHAH